jgi:hypothetical protein
MSAGALRFQAKRLLLPAECASTLDTLARAKWDRDLPSRRRRGDYRDLEALSRALAGQFSKFTRLLNGDIEGDRHELLFSDFALFYGESLLDLGHLAEEQQMEAGQARFLQKVLLNTAGILDDLYGQDLQARLGKELNALLVEAAAQEIDPPEAFRNTIATITSTYATMAEDVYRLIVA